MKLYFVSNTVIQSAIKLHTKRTAGEGLEHPHIILPPEHSTMSFETIEIKMAAVFAKRLIAMRGS